MEAGWRKYVLSIGKYDTSLSQKQVNHVWALDIKELFGKKRKLEYKFIIPIIQEISRHHGCSLTSI